MDQATARAQALIDAARALRVAYESQRIAITISVGVGASRAGDTTDTLIARVDASLYATKRAGRDR